MLDLSTVKSEKLRNLMQKSLKFSALSQDQQKEKITQISRLSIEQQEKIFIPFFTENNQEDEKLLQETYVEMADEIEETDKKIKRLEREDNENSSKKEEGQKMDQLLQNL